MGCGASSIFAVHDVDRLPAPQGASSVIAVHDVDLLPAPPAVTRPSYMAGAIADSSDAANLEIAVKGLEECMLYLSKAGDLLDGMDNPALKAAVDLFESGGEILHTVASVIIPPPGGQVIGAVLAIAILVLKASRNVTACRLLASKCADIMKCLVQGALDEDPAQLSARELALKEDIETFHSLAIEIHVFVEGTTDQNWAKKMSGSIVGIYDIVATVKNDMLKLEEMIESRVQADLECEQILSASRSRVQLDLGCNNSGPGCKQI
eukprot:gene11988-15083_t